jgi:hypothetical protein
VLYLECFPKERDMQKWEHKRLAVRREKPRFTTEWSAFKTEIDGKALTLAEFDKYMNTLGEQGWELVSTCSMAYQSDNNWRGMTDAIYYYFKPPTQ